MGQACMAAFNKVPDPTGRDRFERKEEGHVLFAFFCRLDLLDWNTKGKKPKTPTRKKI